MDLKSGGTVHELGIAQNILEIMRQHVPDSEAPMVRLVKVRVGDFSGVVADSLEFCFGAITADSPFAAARMEIERVPTRIVCEACGRKHESDGMVFICPECGGSDIRIVSGRELDVVAIELEDAEVA
jgi:hydrogenase nickel incorporation protein HypA/HybF